MEGLTGEQWQMVILADGAALALAALVAVWLIRHRHPGFGVVVGLALAFPPVVALWWLLDELTEEENNYALFCIVGCSPYESHWLGWYAAGALSFLVLLVTGVVAAWRGWRYWRRRTAAEQSTG